MRINVKKQPLLREGVFISELEENGGTT